MTGTTIPPISTNLADLQTLEAELSLLKGSMEAARTMLGDSRSEAVTPEQIGYLMELFVWRLDMIGDHAMMMARRLTL